ncbi:MAG: IS21 family transposase [Burkholderiaceae bacterium]|jgi:transposase
MDIIYEIRRRHAVQKQSISAIAREMGLSRPTVRKHLNTVEEPKYVRNQPASPKLGEFQSRLERWLEQEAELARPRRRTAQRLFEGLQEIGYNGAYDSVQRFVKGWKSNHHGPKLTQAFVPLLFVAGDACQFDWSHEQVELGGVLQTVKVAHFRLAYSRQMFVIAYPRETQEMVFDAHNRAFAFFGGVPARMIYDNLKCVVDAVFTGKDRKFNRRFLCLANHYLFEPVACTPASGWEKGQVENQVGNIREWLFTPLARFGSFAELNDWLAVRCTQLAQRNHPTQTGRTIAAGFAEERELLRPITACFDGYVEDMMRVSSTCLVRVDRNRYSVPASAAGTAVSVRKTADQIRVVAHGEVIAAHPRLFGRDQLVCDPWHYLPVLEKKPGALRNGAPFVTWELPKPVQIVRDRILKQPKGDRAFVELLMLAGKAGMDALTVACELALETGVVSGSVVMNELRRLIAPHLPVPAIDVPSRIALRMEPLANCQRYDFLLGSANVH